MTALVLFLLAAAVWCGAIVWLAARKEEERRGDVLRGLVAITAVGGVCAAIGGCVGYGMADGDPGVEEVRQLYSFPDGGSGSDSIASGGLWQGAALYDITLSTDAHLVVLYDNTTGTVAMCPWPDPTSPQTGYLYVNPLDRDAVLRRIAEREGKDAQAREGYNVYSFEQGREKPPAEEGSDDLG